MALRFAQRIDQALSNNLTAADVMTSNPKSIRHTATFRNSNEFLSAYGIHAAPVIDEAGRPIGVVSRTDFVGYWGCDRDRSAALATGEPTRNATNVGIYHRVAEPTVMQIMTPVVHCVPIDASIAKIMEKFLKLEVRCLFVTDEHAVLVGVISVFDLLRSIAEPFSTMRPAPRGTARNRPLTLMDHSRSTS
jgi:CBS-domain-containing membrane protein